MGSSDELRRLLDELGVEYTTYDTTAYEAVIWTGSVCKWIALPSEYGLAVAVYKDYLTPEQAIAATVGNVDYAITFAPTLDRPPETMVGETVFDSEGVAIGWITNAMVGRETLTAEQVRECAKGVYFEGYGDGATHRGHGIEETDWQTIADKLNATLGAGTCHFKVVIDQDPSRRGRGNICECDKCGYRCSRGFIEDERFKHCPNCGKRITKEDE